MGVYEGYEGFMVSINDSVRRKYYKLGKFHAKRPWFSICSFCLLFLLLLPGLSLFFFEIVIVKTDNNELWIPPGTDEAENGDHMVDYFVDIPRLQVAILERTDNSQSVLDASTLMHFVDIHEAILNTKSGSITYDLLCTKVAGECVFVSPAMFWNFNRTVIADLTPDAILAQFKSLPTATMSSLVGGLTLNAKEELIDATAMRATYFVIKNDDTADDAMDWEGELIDFFDDYKPEGYVLNYSAYRSMDDAGMESVMGDFGLFIMAFVIMIIYLSYSLGKRNWLLARPWPAVCALISILMAVVMGFSVSFILGYPFTAIAVFLPLLIQGVGVDNAFLIIAPFSATNTADPIRKRMGETLSAASVNTLAVALISMIAFLIGSTSSLGAIEAFCIQAALCVFFAYIAMFVVFPALLVLDERRVKKNNSACIPCCVSVKPREQNAEAISGLSKFLGDAYTNFITKKPVAIMIIFLFLCSCGLGGYSIINVDIGLNFNDFMFAVALFFDYGIFPESHYLIDYNNVVEEKFSSIGETISIVFKQMDYSDRIYQDAIDDMLTTIQGLDIMAPKSVGGWYYEYRTWVQDPANNHTSNLRDNGFPDNNVEFYKALGEFLASDAGAAFVGEVIFEEGSEVLIITSRMEGREVQLLQTTDQIDAMEDIIDATSMVIARSPKDFDVYCFTFFFTFLRGEAGVVAEIYRNIIIATLTVFFFSFPIMIQPLGAFIMLVLVIIVDLQLIFAIKLFGLALNTVTMVEIIMAIGLLVDLCLHSSYVILITPGTPRERVSHALSTVGASIFNGGLSTFLAVMVMAVSSSFVFKSFFYMVASLVVCGLLAGIVLGPALYSLLAPTPIRPPKIIEDPEFEDPSSKAEKGVPETPKEEEMKETKPQPETQDSTETRPPTIQPVQQDTV